MLEIEIPGLPGYNEERKRVLSINRRGHWSDIYRVIKSDSDKTILSILKHGRPKYPLERADVEIKIHFRTRTRRDPDNLMPLVKGVMDGLVHAGVIIDDSTRNVRLSVKEGEPAVPEYYTLKVTER